MNKYKVSFEVYSDNSAKPRTVTIEVEAGNKKLAAIRGLREINKSGDFASWYKQIKTIEEVNI